MRLLWSPLIFSTLIFSATINAQSFEASVSFGESVFPSNSAKIGTPSPDPASGTYKMTDGFRLGFRMTLNSWRFMGHEFGYAYSRTGVAAPETVIPAGSGGLLQPAQTIPAQTISVPSHQGFYDFLVYAAPEGF